MFKDDVVEYYCFSKNCTIVKSFVKLIASIIITANLTPNAFVGSMHFSKKLYEHHWRAVTSEADHAVGMLTLVMQLTCNIVWVGQNFCPKFMLFSKRKKRSSLEIILGFLTFCPKIIVFPPKKKVFAWDKSQISLILSQNRNAFIK